MRKLLRKLFNCDLFMLLVSLRKPFLSYEKYDVNCGINGKSVNYTLSIRVLWIEIVFVKYFKN